MSVFRFMFSRREIVMSLPMLFGCCSERATAEELTGAGSFPFWQETDAGQFARFFAYVPPREMSPPQDLGPGAVLVVTAERRLYYATSSKSTIGYSVGVGREGKEFRGTAVIGRKAEWPQWHPTEEMIKRDPERFAQYAGGMGGGPDNPLGARALYLYQEGRDTLFRIHGTNRPDSIGTASSAGCIRMRNEDIVDLYDRVELGAVVHVI